MRESERGRRKNKKTAKKAMPRTLEQGVIIREKLVVGDRKQTRVVQTRSWGYGGA